MANLAKVLRIGAPLFAAALAGCSSAQTPLVAGAVDQVGLAATGGVQDQGASATLGYRGAKFAVVPAQNAKGQMLWTRDGEGIQTFSVFTKLGIERHATISDTALAGATAKSIEQVVAVGKSADIYAKGEAEIQRARP